MSATVQPEIPSASPENAPAKKKRHKAVKRILSAEDWSESELLAASGLSLESTARGMDLGVSTVKRWSKLARVFTAAIEKRGSWSRPVSRSTRSQAGSRGPVPFTRLR